MARISILARALVIALIATAIVGEEAVSTKGSPVAFGADVAKVLDIFIHALYMNRNIFLREIISNGSDALDKIRFMYLTNPKEPKNDNGETPTLDIRIRVDKEKRQFIMRDGGVGMTKEDMTNNLGSLGSSGTKNFLEKMKENSDNNNDGNLIGQFGVGFYSVFLVADRITVASKNDASDKQWVWESTGDGTYFIYEDERGNTLGRGTELTLQMKRDADEYLDTDKIKEIVHKYSEFIHFPIYVEVTKTEKVPKAKTESDDEKPESEDKDEDKEEETEEVIKTEWELINENKPIWTRKVNEITEDEYNQFYKSMTKDYADPLYYTHFSAEGGMVFTSILYIPPRAPSNVFDPTATQNNIRLYVRRVFITDEFRDLLPRYLNFIRGVVDSDDLPLHVSREILQENRILKVIKKNLVRKALTMISDIADSDRKLDGQEDKEDKDEEEEKESTGNKKLTAATYGKFWEEYGKALRLGMIEDGNNRARLTKLLRYRSSRAEDKWVSLQDYVSRMPKKQKAIYYISGESLDKIRQSPVLEDATRRDIEVIYMTDAIDEYVVGHITDFNGKKLVNLAKEGANFEEETKKDKAIAAKRKEKYTPLFNWWRDLLGEKVTKVVITKRKTSEPLIISSRQHDITARMANIIKGQALGDKQAHEQTTKRVLELNHVHPLIDEVFKRIQVDPKDKLAEDLALVLYDTANLQNGFDIEDTLAYSRRINRMLRASVDIAPDAANIEEDLSQYEVEEEDDEEPEKDKNEAEDNSDEL